MQTSNQSLNSGTRITVAVAVDFTVAVVDTTTTTMVVVAAVDTTTAGSTTEEEEVEGMIKDPTACCSKAWQLVDTNNNNRGTPEPVSCRPVLTPLNKVVTHRGPGLCRLRMGMVALVLVLVLVVVVLSSTLGSTPSTLPLSSKVVVVTLLKVATLPRDNNSKEGDLLELPTLLTSSMANLLHMVHHPHRDSNTLLSIRSILLHHSRDSRRHHSSKGGTRDKVTTRMLLCSVIVDLGVSYEVLEGDFENACL